MNLEFYNYDTNKKISFETNKHLIAIYGKNGTGKTTLSRNNLFDKKYVFNEDFIYSNVYNITEKGFSQSANTKENFSGLWLGEKIVLIRQEISLIKEHEKYIKTNLQEIINKQLNWFSSRGIPFNIEEKLQYLKIKDFKINYNDLKENEDNYVAINTYKTDINTDNDFLDKINYLRKNDIYNNLISKIQQNKLLSSLILKDKNNYLEDINKKVKLLNEKKELIEKTENIFNEEQITEDIKKKIHEWYMIHESKDHCIFCGNKNIAEQLNKWKNIFTNTLIKDKNELLKELDFNIDSCNKIINEKIYETVDKEIIEYITIVLCKLMESKNNIENNKYEELDFDLNVKNIAIVELKQLIDDIVCYSLNKSINKLEFYYNTEIYIEQLKKEKTNDLDKLMELEGDNIAQSINNIFKNLGLNKNIKITVDKHSIPHKFTYSIKNHRDISELSDGQKHKLALAIFISSIQNDNLENKTIVIDDPVVSLDISSYILFKQFLIHKMIDEKFKSSTRLIILTHDITYLYIQLSNIFDNPIMKNDTIIYKLSDNKITEIPIDYIKTDDISLFKLAIKKCSNINEIKILNSITNKIFRIIIDLRLRFYGISDTTEVGLKLLPVSNDIKYKLQMFSNHLSKVSRQNNTNLSDIYTSFMYIKDTADLFGITDFITTQELNNLKMIIDNNLDGDYNDDIYKIIYSISNFLRKSNNKEMKGYIEHTRNSYTRNLIGLSLDDFFE